MENVVDPDLVTLRIIDCFNKQSLQSQNIETLQAEIFVPPSVQNTMFLKTCQIMSVKWVPIEYHATVWLHVDALILENQWYLWLYFTLVISDSQVSRSL